MGVNEGLCNRGRSEGIGLNKDFRFCFINLTDDCFCTSSFRAETDLGWCVVENEVAGVSWLKGNQKKNEQDYCY